MEGKEKTPIHPLELAYTPLAFRCTKLARKYYEVTSTQLRKFDLERNFFVLSIIGNHDFISQQCLSKSLDIDKASMVRIIDYLSEKGLVKRKPNPEDRREHMLEATPKAKKMIPGITDIFSAMNEQAFKGFSDTEQKKFLSMSYRIMENLSEMPVGESYQVKYVKRKKA
jgi:DNA-binding MarR family transcriptional regulator